MIQMMLLKEGKVVSDLLPTTLRWASPKDLDVIGTYPKPPADLVIDGVSLVATPDDFLFNLVDGRGSKIQPIWARDYPNADHLYVTYRLTFTFAQEKDARLG